MDETTHALAQLPPLDVARRYPINVAAAYLAISRGRLYTKARLGDLVLIRDGRRVFVAGEDIARLSRPATDRRAA